MAEPSATATRDDDATRQTLARLRIDRKPTTRRRRRRWRGLIVIVLIAGAVAVAWRPAMQRLYVPSVAVEQAVRSSATQGAVRTTASGYVVARRRAAISSRLQGRLERLLVDVGDFVSEGELLGELGHSDLDATVAEAEAIVEVRRRDIPVLEGQRRAAEARVRTAEQRLTQARAAVPPAEEMLAEAERILRLREDLVRTGAETPDRLDAARAARKLAARQLDEVRASIPPAAAAVDEGRAEFDVLDARIASAGAEVERAQAALQRAVALRADADILAPFDGIVLRKEAEVGEMVAPVNAAGSTTRGAIVTLADYASLEMEVDVIERDVRLVEEGLPCRISLDARAAPYAGHVRQVVPTADRTRGSVLVKVTFDALDGSVLPEMSGRVEFLDSAAAERVLDEDRVVVPAAGVVRSDGRTFVWTVVDGELRAVDVTLGDEPRDPAGRLRVLTGLRGGEQVVVEPGARLTEGLTVRVRGEAR